MEKEQKTIKHVHNLDQLIRIKVSDKTVDTDFKYQPYKKRWLFKDRSEGFIIRYPYGFYTKEALECGVHFNTKYLIIKNMVFTKPRVHLFFTNDYRAYYEFETVQEASDWVKETILPKKPNLIITYQPS